MNDSNKKTFDIKILSTIIGIIVVLGGFTGQYFTNKAAVAELEKDVAKIEEVFTVYKEKTEERILDMKLDITSSTSDITTIKEDIGEIKVNIRALLVRK